MNYIKIKLVGFKLKASLSTSEDYTRAIGIIEQETKTKDCSGKLVIRTDNVFLRARLNSSADVKKAEAILTAVLKQEQVKPKKSSSFESIRKEFVK